MSSAHYLLLGLSIVLVFTSVALVAIGQITTGGAALTIGAALIAVSMSTGKKSNG